MQDKWVREQWDDLCRRTLRSAEHWGNRASHLTAQFRADAKGFTCMRIPERYPDLLDRVREASRMAVSWSEHVESQTTSDASDTLEQTSVESFPASRLPALSQTIA